VARNRLAVAASAAAVLALVAVSVVAVLQAQRAERSAAEALAEAGRSEATKDLVFAVIRDADSARERKSFVSVRDFVASQIDVRLVDQPKLREEILNQLWDVYADDGDLVGAGAASEKISSSALSSGDVDRAVSTLIGEAYYAVSRGDLEKTRLKLDQVGAVVDPARRRPEERAALHDLEGQLFEAAGDGVGAATEFSRKTAAAREARDDKTVFAGLVDGIRVAGAIGDGLSHGDELAQARGLLVRLPEELRGQSRLLLSATLLRVGAYREGWSEMLRLLASDGAIFAKTDYLSRRAHEVWLEYCVVVGRPRLAEKWLHEFERHRLAPVLRTFERDPLWHLSVAQVHAATQNWVKVRQTLDEARSLLDLPNSKLNFPKEDIERRLKFAEASVALRQGLAQPGRIPLDGLYEKLRDPVSVSTRQGHLWPWMRGILATVTGREQKAIGDLNEAVRRAEAAVGQSHPDVARIQLALALVRSGATRGAPDMEAVKLLRTADVSLREVLPIGHPILGYVDELGGPSRSDSEARRMLIRASSRPLPVSLVP
jgi:hypothetical protein